MMKLFSRFLLLLLLFCHSIFASKLKTKLLLKNKAKISRSDEICQGIYMLGIKYGDNPLLPKFTPASFGKGPQLFTNINMIPSYPGVFEFKFLVKGTQDYKEGVALNEFFAENEFPPKYNWFDLKGCCLKNGAIEGKPIFNQICFSLIFGFINFRYMTMIKYVERAFQEAIQNQEYPLGEIPLSKEEKMKRLEAKMKNPQPISISEQIYKAEHPIVIYKGGRKTIIDEDNYDFLDKSYFDLEGPTVKNLKLRLEKACAISFFIPTNCELFIRVCPFYYDFSFSKYKPDAKKEEEGKGDKSKTHGASDEVFHSFHCLDDGYFVICTDAINFNKKVTEEEKSNDDPPVVSKEVNVVPDEIKSKTLRLLYFGSVTATSDLDFTAVTYQSNMVKNYHLQRMILDNFNHRYQNDRAKQLGAGVKGRCYTSGDCLDTNAYMTGFMESKLDSRQFTGIKEIDSILGSIDNDPEKLDQFREASFFISVALGMTALTDFWEELQHAKLTDKLELENNVDFSEGIISMFDNDMFNAKYFIRMIGPVYKMLEDNEVANNKDYKQMVIKDDYPMFSQKVSEFIKLFVKKVREYLLEVRKIKNELNKEIFLTSDIEKFRRSVKLNEGYTLLSIIAIEEISHIQPDFATAMAKYEAFSIKAGVSLMYANEAYFNKGGIKYQTKSKKLIAPCSTMLEATFMIMGYDLLHYYELYPKVKPPNDVSGTEPEGYALFDHGDALLKLGKYFGRVLDICVSECKLFNKDHPLQIFLTEFKTVGFIDDDIEGLKENGEDYTGPSDAGNKKQTKLRELYIKIDNFRVLSVFSKLAMKMKKTYGLEPLTLYMKTIELEKNVLGKYFKGYEVGNIAQNIIAISKLAQYILSTMSFSYLLSQKIWNVASSLQFKMKFTKEAMEDQLQDEFQNRKDKNNVEMTEVSANQNDPEEENSEEEVAQEGTIHDKIESLKKEIRKKPLFQRLQMKMKLFTDKGRKN